MTTRNQLLQNLKGLSSTTEKLSTIQRILELDASSVTYTAAAFTQPAVGAEVSVEVDSTATFAELTGQVVKVGKDWGSGFIGGYYEVREVDTVNSVVALKNIATGYSATGVSIPEMSPLLAIPDPRDGILDYMVNVKRFGAAGDGVVDDKAAFQAANDYIATLGGGIVWIPNGIYIVSSSVEVSAGVVFVGASPRSTIIKLKDGSNDDVFRTENFGLLTGTASGLPAQGVPYFFGFKNLTVDGNRANNSSGCGIRIFGKRYLIDNVVVAECAEDGVYSESGTTGNPGGSNSWGNMPETLIRGLYVQRNAGYGLRYLGPHDGVIESVFPASNGLSGLYVGGALSPYSGLCDVRYVHAYANNVTGGLAGVEIWCQCRFGLLQSEQNWRGGIYIGDSSSTSLVMIEAIRVFSNNRSAANWPGLHIDDANTVSINSGIIEDANNGGGALLGGDRMQITNLRVLGSGPTSPTYGVKLADVPGGAAFSENRLQLNINFCGTGLVIGDAGGSEPRDSYVIADISNCGVLISGADEGVRNEWNLRGFFSSATQTLYSGTFGLNSDSVYHINFEDFTTGAYYTSKQRLLATMAVDLTATSEQYLTFSHQHWRVPSAQHVSFQIVRKAGASAAYGIRFAEAAALSINSAVLRIRMDEVETPPATLTVSAVDTASDYLTTSIDHGLVDNDLCYLTSSGAVPGGLVSGTKYLVDKKANNELYLLDKTTLQRMDITDVGSGTITLRPVQNAFAYAVIDTTKP